MGLGGLNRVLLTVADLSEDGRAYLSKDDARAKHIRTLLARGGEQCTLRVAVEDGYLHDSARCEVHEDGSCSIEVPSEDRRAVEDGAPITLLLAMQRPKAMARIIQSGACVGVRRIVLVDSDKTEATYWQSKLLRVNGECAGDGDELNEMALVRRLLVEGVQQAAKDGRLPSVTVDRRKLDAVTTEYARGRTTRLVAHPRNKTEGERAMVEGSVVAQVARGDGEVVMAIGPEGGWSDEEVRMFRASSFAVVQLGERVLRSETAVVVALALVHEGLRWRRACWTLQEQACDSEGEGV
ncbi:Ribosomal RNA small subunit methyltransferase E 1 [Gracilariopsis chorda]|uniref:16S rRNA (uracil(1498)-N(3))-methyltransferase n=1 Tax=Gracilariopsis chorda TaxID=448386 RepID=A0A2V3IEN7_9FLOR|nr:Ribosomal RNA small subunit methyltransferase E 1 [Gracilariopsis chorda]|eukprot:PXF40549.1 Ribosomal RNA small subunit methyltransferase E 1 [Gracilariopsis chorda]